MDRKNKMEIENLHSTEICVPLYNLNDSISKMYHPKHINHNYGYGKLNNLVLQYLAIL